MSVVTIPGVEFPFPGGARVIPPLALGDLEQLLDRINALQQSGLPDKEGIGTIIDATHAALKRNYPELTRADVGELVDLGNMMQVLHAVMNASGLERKAAEPGEAPAP